MEYNEYPEIRNLINGLAAFEINLSDLQIQKFIEYYELLVEKNKVMNLTAITEFSEVIDKHFIDSLSIVKALKLSKEKIIDIGTGAGFPGIPLKIVFPDIEVILLDSLNKRLVFLDEVIEKLDLKKVKTLHGRAEDFGKDIKYREQFDLCVSRAVAKLASLSEYCLPYVKKGGHFISYKSGKAEDELVQAANAIETLGAQVEKVENFILPGTDIERSLIVLKKISQTPKLYPRSAGKPTKEPL